MNIKMEMHPIIAKRLVSIGSPPVIVEEYKYKTRQLSICVLLIIIRDTHSGNLHFPVHFQPCHVSFILNAVF